jgi:sec-independent protein translocase protein TatB
MFDMSFSEIAVIGVVALVVLGPERLPKVARTAGHMFGRLQRYVATVKADINREMDTSELAKIKQEVQDAARSFEQTVQQTANSVEKETTAISQSVESQTPPPESTVSPAPAQKTMLAEQENGMGEGLSEVPGAERSTDVKVSNTSPAPISASSSARPDYPAEANFDFGIEPVRMSKSA